MRTKCLLVAAVLVVLIACTYQYPATSGYPASAPIPAFALGPQKTTMSLASDDGAPVDMKPYFIIEMPNSSIPARGRVWSAILNSAGIVSHVFTIQQIMAKPTLLQHVPAALLDASLGSANGSQVSSSFMHLLVSCDVALVLTGRAAWLLHSLRGTPLGSVTATASQRLLTAQGYEAAIFLSLSNRAVGEFRAHGRDQYSVTS